MCINLIMELSNMINITDVSLNRKNSDSSIMSSISDTNHNEPQSFMSRLTSFDENNDINNSDNIEDIMNRRINNPNMNKILSHIGIENVISTLTNLQNILYKFIADKFPLCNTCNDIHFKYKLLINAYIINLKNIVATFTIDKQKELNNYIKDIDSNTIFLFKKLDSYDDINRDNIVSKFKLLINICTNITILNTYWRREIETVDTVFNSSYVYYEEIIRDLLVPYIKEIRFYMENKRVCEPRILTGHYDENQIHASRLNTPSRNNNIVNASVVNTSVVNTSVASLDETMDFGFHSDKTLNNITGARKQISFDELSAIIGQSYGNNPDLECSTALDIFASYLRGQKQLYIEAKNYSEKYLNMLSFPAIIISSAVGLLALILTTRLGFIIVAIMSAVNTIIMSLISLLKLDAKSEAHRTSAYHYDKLETKCSFMSGRIMFDSNSDDINEVISFVEKKISEIKEINQFVLPEHVRMMFPKTYSSNIFSQVKKLYVEEVILKNNLKNIINDMIIKSRKEDKTLEDISELQELKRAQDKLLNKILAYKKKYLDLDSSLKYEIKKSDYIKKFRAYTCLNLLDMCLCNALNKCLLIAGPKKPSDYSSESTQNFDDSVV